MCKKYPNKEWSGFIFYRVEGSIEQPETLLLTVEDLYLMDIGVQSYTSYTLADHPQIMGYMTRNGLLMHRWGHVHSHNNMEVFFSGTDLSELADNTPQHMMYLSIITNNKTNFDGRLCYQVKETVKTIRTTRLKADGNLDYREEAIETVQEKEIEGTVSHKIDFLNPWYENIESEEFLNNIARIEELDSKKVKTVYQGAAYYGDGLFPKEAYGASQIAKSHNTEKKAFKVLNEWLKMNGAIGSTTENQLQTLEIAALQWEDATFKKAVQKFENTLYSALYRELQHIAKNEDIEVFSEMSGILDNMSMAYNFAAVLSTIIDEKLETITVKK